MNQVKELLGRFDLSGDFKAQPLEIGSSQIKIRFEHKSFDAPLLVSELAKTKSVFELEICDLENERYLHHPSLGICRNELDEAGEVVLRAGQLERLLLETSGNLSDFSRGFRRLTAVPWLDLIEPYRKASEYLIALPRAV